MTCKIKISQLREKSQSKQENFKMKTSQLHDQNKCKKGN